jgi:hypothetical protein
LAAALLLGACGAGAHSTTTSVRTAASHSTRPAQAPGSGGTSTAPATAPHRAAANAAAVQVIKAWSDALRRGDVRGAARYFALPSVMVNGIGPGGKLAVISIRTAAEAFLANETLPCGAKFVSGEMQGRFVNVLFVLTGRPGPGGSDCGSGRGGTARTSFKVVRSRIQEWIRTPDQPGDNPGAAPQPVNPQPSPAQPTIPQPPSAGPVA